MEEVGQYDCGRVSEGAWIVLSIRRSISFREKVRQSNILKQCLRKNMCKSSSNYVFANQHKAYTAL